MDNQSDLDYLALFPGDPLTYLEARSIAQSEKATHQVVGTHRVIFYRQHYRRWEARAYFVATQRLASEWRSVPSGLPSDAKKIWQE